jgi:LacI family transcriptional regulator
MKNNNGKSKRKRTRATANDVARLAGVSQMTVSRVINNDPAVRDKTRETVLKAVDELGYVPNKAARSLVSANPIRIGLLYSNPNSTFLSKMMEGVLDRARQSDTQVVIVTCDEGPEAMGTVTSLIGDGIDGIVLAPPLCGSKPLFDILGDAGIPACTVGSRHGDDRISAVFMDDKAAASTMTRHLLSLGHRRIGIIVGDSNQNASLLRLDGFRQTLDAAGIQVDESLVIRGQFSFRSGFVAAERMLQMPNRPSAILASNDDMAAGAITAALKFNLRVPEDVTVCGFDDSLMSSQFWPPITTIHQPIRQMTQAAIEHLESNIRRVRSGSAAQRRRIEMDFSLVQRESDAPPAGGALTVKDPSERIGLARKYSSGSSRKPPVV